MEEPLRGPAGQHLFEHDRAFILKAMNQAVTRLYVQDDEGDGADEQAV